MPAISEHEPERVACSCGCVCCSSVSSAMYLKVGDGKTKKRSVLVSVGVQTDKQTLATGSTWDKLSDFSSSRFELLVDKATTAKLPQVHVIDESSAVKQKPVSVNNAGSGRQQKRKSQKKVTISGASESSDKEGGEAPHRRTRLSERIGTDVENVSETAKHTQSGSCRTSLYASKKVVSSVEPAHAEVNTEQVEVKITVDQACSSGLQQNEGVVVGGCGLNAGGNVNGSADSHLTVGVWLGSVDVAAKALVNAVLNCSRMTALVYLAQPALAAAKRRGTRNPLACETLQDGARLVAECDWLLVCIDNGDNSHLEQLTALVKTRASRTASDARTLHLVLVCSKPINQKPELGALAEAVASCGWPLLDMAFILSWDPVGFESSCSSNGQVNDSRSPVQSNTVRRAKVVVRCNPAKLYSSFMNCFGTLFETCVPLYSERTTQDVVTQYFNKMEADVLVGASSLPAVPRALHDAFASQGQCFVIDACVSNVLRNTLILLVELNSEGSASTRRSVNGAKSAHSKHVGSKLRKIVVVNFNGKVLATVQTRCARLRQPHNFTICKLLFDYMWQTEHRIVVSALETQRHAIRLCSVPLDYSSDSVAVAPSNGDCCINGDRLLIFDVYLGSSPMCLTSADCDTTPFVADFAGEYEASAGCEFANFMGAQWGFCGVRNTVFELLIHGKRPGAAGNFSVFAIHGTEEAQIRAVKFLPTRSLLLVSAYCEQTMEHSMHFLRLNDSTKLFEPHVVSFSRAACPLYSTVLQSRSELLVFDETRARMHFFAVVDAGNTRNANRNCCGGKVHGDRFLVDDDLNVIHEDCFPEFRLTSLDSASELEHAVHSILDSPRKRPETQFKLLPQSLCLISFSQKFKNFVWCSQGSLYSTNRE